MKTLNRHLVAAAFVLLAVILFFNIRRSESQKQEEALREDNAAEAPVSLGSNLTDVQKTTEQQMIEQVAQAKRDDALRYSREEIYMERHVMKRDGAQAKITLRVVDTDGTPVANAKVKAYFTQPEGSSNSALVTGASDENGLFTMEKLTKYQCRWEISKKGFYETQGRYEWQSKFTMEAYRTKRWQPWNPTIEVVLKKVFNPVKMQRKVMTLKFPANTKVGFDFLEGDLVEPFGRGFSSNLLFFVSGTADNGKFYYTNTVTFPAGNGYIRLGEDFFSELKSLQTAPESGYSTQILFTYGYDREKKVLDDNNLKNEYMILKLAASSEEKKIYGKMTKGIIGGLDYPDTDMASVTFTYYLNPTPDDRSLEYEDTYEFKTRLGKEKSE